MNENKHGFDAVNRRREETVFCVDCGKPVPRGADACPNCGTRDYSLQPTRRGRKCHRQQQSLPQRLWSAVAAAWTGIINRLPGGDDGDKPRGETFGTETSSGAEGIDYNRRSGHADAAADAPQRKQSTPDVKIKNIGKRRSYRYDNTRKRTRWYQRSEIRAIIIIALVFLAALLICQHPAAPQTEGRAEGTCVQAVIATRGASHRHRLASAWQSPPYPDDSLNAAAPTAGRMTRIRSINAPTIINPTRPHTASYRRTVTINQTLRSNQHLQ